MLVKFYDNSKSKKPLIVIDETTGINEYTTGALSSSLADVAKISLRIFLVLTKMFLSMGVTDKKATKKMLKSVEREILDIRDTKGDFSKFQAADETGKKAVMLALIERTEKKLKEKLLTAGDSEKAAIKKELRALAGHRRDVQKLK